MSLPIIKAYFYGREKNKAKEPTFFYFIFYIL